MKTKILLTLLYLSTLAGYIIAQAPGFNYQAVLRDAQGEVMPNAEITLIISLSDGPQGLTLYRETHALLTDELGILNTVVGRGTVEAGEFASIVGIADLNIKLEANIPGEPDVVDVGNSSVGATPFALYGEDADADPENEMQSLSLVGDTLKISGTPGVSLQSFKSPLERVEEGFRLDLSETQRDQEDISDLIFSSIDGVTINGDEESHSMGSHTSSWSQGERSLSNTFGRIDLNLDEQSVNKITDLAGLDTPWVETTVGMVTRAPSLLEVKGLTSPGEGFLFREFGDLTFLTKQIDDICLQSFYNEGGILADAFYDGQRGTVGVDFYSEGGVFGGGLLTGTDFSLAAFRTLGAIGNSGLSAEIGSTTGGSGDLTVRAPDGKTAGRLTNIIDFGGVLILYDTSGQNEKIRLGCDGEGKAGIWVDDQRVFGPAVVNEGRKITDEGTIQLVEGEATVYCNHEFTHFADPEKMTVHLTPLSAKSRGLAVTEKFAGGFKIKEINAGLGNYEVDWLVRSKIVKLDNENMEIVHPEAIKEWATHPIKDIQDFVIDEDRR